MIVCPLKQQHANGILTRHCITDHFFIWIRRNKQRFRSMIVFKRKAKELLRRQAHAMLKKPGVVNYRRQFACTNWLVELVAQKQFMAAPVCYF